MINITVSRFNPEKDKNSYFEDFKVEKKEKMKILDALNFINEKYSANIAFRSSCRAGQCGSCALKLNGEVVLACKEEVTDNCIIEPIDLPIIKDLIVDRTQMEETINNLGLFLETCDGEKSSNELEDTSESCGCPNILNPNECFDTKKIRSCIECYSCLSACPVLKESDEFSGPFFIRYLSKFAFDPRDCGDKTEKSIDEGLYCCTSCGKCAEVCPKEISLMGDAIEKMRSLSNKKDLGPLDAHKAVNERIKNTGRSVDYLDESFIEKTILNSDLIDKDSKIALFTGCMVDYRLQKVALALINVLNKNNITIDVPENQTCCGSPLIRTGQLELLPELTKTNEEALGKYDTIITLCAGCGATLKNDYPNYGVNLNVLDISEFILNKLDYDKMKPLDLKVTYHDPCHLVRGQGISIEPRDILNKIPGVDFIEMNEADTCCGSGGGVKAGKPEIAYSLGERKAKNIKEADVDVVITICPFCQYHILDSLENYGIDDVKVMNILELVEMAYE